MVDRSVNRAPWNFVHAEVKRIARQEFGVVDPIELRVKRRKLQANGFYSVRLTTGGWHVWRSDRVHDIMVVTGHGPNMYPIDEVLRVLAHELWHAFQAEQHPSPTYFSRAYRAQRDEFEDDAQAAEPLWYHLKPAINERRTA